MGEVLTALVTAIAGIAIGCAVGAPWLYLAVRDTRRRRQREAWDEWRIPARPDLRDVGAMALWEVRRRLR
jgi:hypothetical protein